MAESRYDGGKFAVDGEEGDNISSKGIASLLGGLVKLEASVHVCKDIDNGSGGCLDASSKSGSSSSSVRLSVSLEDVIFW